MIWNWNNGKVLNCLSRRNSDKFLAKWCRHKAHILKNHRYGICSLHISRYRNVPYEKLVLFKHAVKERCWEGCYVPYYFMFVHTSKKRTIEKHLTSVYLPSFKYLFCVITDAKKRTSTDVVNHSSQPYNKSELEISTRRTIASMIVNENSYGCENELSIT